MSIDKRKVKKALGLSIAAVGTVFVGLSIAAKIKKKSSVYENAPQEKNPMEGKKVVFVKNDDDKENAITKMSLYHFTATEEYRKRVIQLGEQPDKVFYLGALGAENCLYILAYFMYD